MVIPNKASCFPRGSGLPHLLVWLGCLLVVVLLDTTTAASLLDEALSPSTANSYRKFLSDFNVDDSYENKIMLGKNKDDMALWWTIDRESSMLEIAVAVGASSWTSFGIADAGGMPGADMVVFEANKPQVLQDYYAMDFVRPTLDTCNDWTLLDSVVEDNFIAFRATRALDTGDAQDRPLMDDSDPATRATPIIVAWGDQPEGLSYHGKNRDRTFVRFFHKEQQVSGQDILEAASDGSFRVVNQNYTVPETETTYYDVCVDVADIPQVPQEGVDIIGAVMVPSIQVNGVDTSDHVHHFVGYGRYGPCSNPLSPVVIFYGWAPGQEPLILPETVGARLGGPTGYQSINLNIHYDNREQVPNVLDSSGIEIFYVNSFREHQFGSMVVGDGANQLSGQPVGVGSVGHTLSCPGSCTRSHFGNESVTVFGELFHEHEKGQRVTHQVIRDGEIIHEISVEVWDFYRSGFKMAQIAPYELMPGDEFRTTCYYLDEDGSRFFGSGTQDEMCQVVFWYYPVRKIYHGFCGSGLATYFGDPTCEASHEPFLAADDFDRSFGSSKKSIAECKNEDNPTQAPSSGAFSLVKYQGFAATAAVASMALALLVVV